MLAATASSEGGWGVARLLFAIELTDAENRARPAQELAVRLRAHYGSTSRAAAQVGVTRQAFHDWLNGEHVSVKHIVAMAALLAITLDEPLDGLLDDTQDR